MSTKSFRFGTVAVFAVCVLVAGAIGLSAAVRQGPPAGPPPGGPGCGAPPLEPILSELNLTSQQQTAIDALIEAHHDAMDGQKDAVMAAHKALHDAVVAETFDEAAIRQAAAAVAVFEAMRAVADATLLKDVRNLLSDEQRAELNDLLSKMPPPDRPGHGGPGGPPPGKGRGAR